MRWGKKRTLWRYPRIPAYGEAWDKVFNNAVFSMVIEPEDLERLR